MTSDQATLAFGAAGAVTTPDFNCYKSSEYSEIDSARLIM
jgi:hypothetical protein